MKKTDGKGRSIRELLGGKNRYEIEHIWANHPERHQDEFSHPSDFAAMRNRVGGLPLLPKNFNASYGDLTYEEKLPHYHGQNLLARSLHPNCVYLGDNLLLYDHESAFSHFLTILPKPPWEAGGVDFLKDHIFLLALRGETLELDRLQGALEAIDGDRLSEYLQVIPSEWDGQAVTGDKIRSHMLKCIGNFKRIQLQLQATL